MQLGNKNIGSGNPVFFIAEMSGNHNNSLAKALEIVDAAADSGADALKIQTYKPETMTIDCDKKDFYISDPGSLWKNRTLFELYSEAMTPWEWHEPIMERCLKRNLLFFSSPFDSSAVDFLERMDVPFYKIASFENKDIALLKKVAKTKKPIIVSTGASTIVEIAEAVAAIQEEGNNKIVLLKCTSSYPAKFCDANLRTISTLKDIFNLEVGLSDHTMGCAVPIMSTAFGASVIEKHFTISRSDGGVDSSFSMEPAEFATMVKEVGNAKDSIGNVSFKLAPDEMKSIIFKRSLYITEDISEGDLLTEKNIRAIRPGNGIEPKYLSVLIGKRASRNLERGTPVSWDII